MRFEVWNLMSPVNSLDEIRVSPWIPERAVSKIELLGSRTGE